MTIMRLHHANISIPPDSEAEARAFYCDVLGLPEIEKPDALKPNGGFWLRLGNCDVHIGTQADIDRHALKMHLAYEVDDLSTWREKLESAGIRTKDNTAIPDFDRFEIRDPFGNRIEFVQPRT
ncbi:MAG: VOC family protein [Chloroflexota bacterium]